MLEVVFLTLPRGVPLSSLLSRLLCGCSLVLATTLAGGVMAQDGGPTKPRATKQAPKHAPKHAPRPRQAPKAQPQDEDGYPSDTAGSGGPNDEEAWEGAEPGDGWAGVPDDELFGGADPEDPAP